MNKYRVTAGIFLSLIGEIRYQDEKRSNRMDCISSIHISYPTLFKHFTSIIGGDYYIANPISKTVTEFKTCRGQGGTDNITIIGDKCSNYFTDQIKNNYDLLLLKIKKMLQGCIANTKEARLLVTKRIWFVLNNSSSFDDKDIFYPTSSSRKAITKKELLKLKNYDFPALVLALWHASIAYIKSNKTDTFKDLFYKCDSKQEFLFNTELDKEIPNDIDIFNELSPNEPISIPNEIDEDDEIKKEPQIEESEVHESNNEIKVEIIDDSNKDSKEAKVVSQRVINLNGDHAKYFENVGVLNIKDDD